MRFEQLTRGKVLQIGFALFALGGLGYVAFRGAGFDAALAGIASEAALIFLVVAWIGSYLFRVLTGRMTFMEQRKRYRDAYEKLSTAKLQEMFDELPEKEQIRLMEELDSKNTSINTSD